MTSCDPAVLAVVLAVLSVSETTATEVAAAPIVTVEPARKPLPLILTAVPPAVGPWVGSTEVTVGGAAQVYVGPAVELPPASETITSWAPAAVAAVVAVISVSETTVTEVAELPILTVAGEMKPVPLILTGVPPAIW